MNCGHGESAQRRGQIGYCIHSVCVFAHVDMCSCTYAGKHTWSASGLNVLSIIYLQSDCQISLASSDCYPDPLCLPHILRVIHEQGKLRKLHRKRANSFCTPFQRRKYFMLSQIMAVNLHRFKAQLYFVFTNKRCIALLLSSHKVMLGPVAAAAFPYNTLSMSAHGKAKNIVLLVLKLSGALMEGH